MQAALRAMLEGRRTGTAATLLRGGMLPLGLAHGGIAAARRRLYEANFFCRNRMPVPVLSVGNLTAGGTGKTPFVVMLCRMLRGLGRKPAVLLRGYGAANPQESDEALLYARLLPEAGIYPGRVRVNGALRALQDGFDVLVLDDGFQHLRLMRDLDLVLLDATCPFGGGWPLPAGLLREPLSALARADVICLTRTDQVSEGTIELIQEKIRVYARDVPVLTCTHRPSRLSDLDHRAYSLDTLAGLKVAALSGIGRPDSFANTLRDLGAEVCAEVAFADHAAYTARDVQRVTQRLDPQWTLVVTEKDAVKLADVVGGEDRARWLALGIEMRLAGLPQLRERVSQALTDFPRL